MGAWKSLAPDLMDPEDGKKAFPKGLVPQPHSESVKRHLDIYDIEISLNEVSCSICLICKVSANIGKIAEGSTRTLDFSQHYGARAHQTQRSGPVPGSLPTLAEVDDMIRQTNRVAEALAQIKDVIITQHNVLAEQQAQRQSLKNENFEDDGSVYQEEFKGGGGFAGADAKKRRGV